TSFYPALIVFKSQITCQQPSNHRGKNLDDIPENLICEKPKIVRFENKKGGPLLHGETLHLVCEASGLPEPDITITLPSGHTPDPTFTIKPGGRNIITVTKSAVTAVDAGQYICIATNAGGSSSSKLYVDVVPEKPKIVRFENKKIGAVVQGETLHLICEASGLPKPDIKIVIPSGLTPTPTVKSGGRNIIVTMTKSDVTAVDAGQYICIATNAGGSASDKLYVEVETPTSVMPGVSTGTTEISEVTTPTPTIQGDSTTLRKPTIVWFKINYNTEVHGETPYLVCEASGILPPNIIITLPSGLNVTSGRVIVGVNGTITITNVSAADVGLYTCIASNPAGSASATVLVDAQTNASVLPTFNTYFPVSKAPPIGNTLPFVSPPSNAPHPVSTAHPLRNSEVRPSNLPFAVGLGTFLGVLLISGLLIAFCWKQKPPNDPGLAPTIFPPNTDGMVNSSNNDSGTAGPNEELNMPENVYENPDSDMDIISCEATSGNDGPEDQFVHTGGPNLKSRLAPDSRLVHNALTVHELVNIVYGKDVHEDPDSAMGIKSCVAAGGNDDPGDQFDAGGPKLKSGLPPKSKLVHNPLTVHELVNVVYGKDVCETGHNEEASAATSHSINGENEKEVAEGEEYATPHYDDKSVFDKKSSVEGASRVIYDSTNGQESGSNASSQVVYHSEEGSAVSVASPSIYKHDKEKQESPNRPKNYETDNQKKAVSVPRFIYENSE
ncbi:uncharacterized protein LOC144867614, partial [Branchiostoma floridae x Branchiostoma japonicum]